jgi:16S rRNA (cytosine1402-N4)-methyltransferase
MKTLWQMPYLMKIYIINENFRFIKRFCVFVVKSVDGILADLGVSSHQFDVRKEVFYPLMQVGYENESEK